MNILPQIKMTKIQTTKIKFLVEIVPALQELYIQHMQVQALCLICCLATD